MPTNKAPLSQAANLLAHKEKKPPAVPLSPLDHIAYAILRDQADDAACFAVLARVRQHFVDWNEARLARAQELARLLDGVRDRELCGGRIKEAYNRFFEEKGALAFDFLGRDKPADAKKQLQRLLPCLRKGGLALLLYEFCPGAPFPLSEAGLAQAKKDGVGGKGADRARIGKLLAESLTAAEICRLAQIWELECSGNPYGEVEKAAGKKGHPAKGGGKKASGKTAGK